MTRRFLARLVAPTLAVSLAACNAGTAGAPPSNPPAATAEPTDAGATAAPTPTPTPTPVPTAAPTAAPANAPTATPGPSAAPLGPDGQTGRIRLSDAALAVTLPKGWMSIAVTADDVQSLIDAMPEGTLPAGLADQLPALVASGLKLWAWDVRASGMGANLNVVAQPLTLPPSLLKVSAQAGLGLVPGLSNVKYTKLEIDGASALRVDYAYAQDVAGGTFHFKGTQIYVARPNNLVVVTVTIPKGGSITDRDKIIASLKLLD